MFVREVYASLVASLGNRGALMTKPFDDSLGAGATLQDNDNEQVTAFVETAEAKGRLFGSGKCVNVRLTRGIMLPINAVYTQ